MHYRLRVLTACDCLVSLSTMYISVREKEGVALRSMLSTRRGHLYSLERPIRHETTADSTNTYQRICETKTNARLLRTAVGGADLINGKERDYLHWRLYKGSIAHTTKPSISATMRARETEI